MDKTQIEQLITQARIGNSEAFGKLYDEFADRLYQYIWLKIQNRTQAEDILQETFIKAWRALPQYRTENGNFSAWLYKIAGNAVYDYFRTLYRKPESLELDEDIAHAVANDSPLKDASRAYDTVLLTEALKALPAHYREVLILRFIQNFNVKETAKILGKTGVSTRIIQHRALKALKVYLTEKHYNMGYENI